MAAGRKNRRGYRESLATAARKSIQDARFWLDYDGDEAPEIDRREVAVRHARDVVGLAERFCAAVEKEAGR